MFRRALEEGLVDPARMLQAGIRGPLYGEDDEGIPAELGVRMIPGANAVFEMLSLIALARRESHVSGGRGVSPA